MTSRRFARSAFVAVVVQLALTGSSHAGVVRYAVIIANDVGDRDEATLRYAHDDADKVRDVIADLGGFASENILVLTGEDEDTVRRALIATNDRIRQITANGGHQVLLMVYYSGHADAEALHLGGTELALTELQQLVRGSPATFRLLILDSCRSGTVVRAKGGRSAPPLVIRVDERLAGEGAVFLTSSAANEDSQESDELKGSFFTHYLVSGLVGAADVNGDGAVALEEAYRYAYDNTLRASSRTLAGTQHPSFHYDVRGQGGIVLTTLIAGARKRATIELPEARTYLLFKRDGDGPVVAEVSGRDAVRRLSVRPGRYFVRGRDRDHLLEGTVVVVAGQNRKVLDRDLERIDYARLVRKGRGPLRFVQGLQTGYRVRTALWDKASACHGGFVGYAVALRGLSIAARAEACHGGFANRSLTASADELGIAARLSHAWDLRSLTADLGVVLGGALLRQRFDTEGTAPTRLSFAVQVGVGAGVVRDLTSGFYLGSDVTASTYVFKQADTMDSEGSRSLTGRLTLGGTLHVGKHW